MLYIFDKDGTLIAPVKDADGERPANKPEEQVVLPGVIEKLAELRAEGHILTIASNQGGVAFGFISHDGAITLMRDVDEKVGGVNRWLYCPHHPDGTRPDYAVDCVYRKPGGGMLFSLMREFDHSPEETVMVGDMESDRLAAEGVGCGFAWAQDFFA